MIMRVGYSCRLADLTAYVVNKGYSDKLPDRSLLRKQTLMVDQREHRIDIMPKKCIIEVKGDWWY